MRDYSRQAVFDQEKLGNANVTIIGAGSITNYLCAYMSGLGIKNISVIDNSAYQNDPNEFLLKSFKGQKCDGLERKVKDMNDETKLVSVNSQILEFLVGKPDVLVDLTNNPISKTKCKDISKKIPCIKKTISASSSENNASVRIYAPKKNGPLILQKTGPKIVGLPESDFSLGCYDGRTQGSFTSGLIAAVVLDEIRKTIIPLENEYPLKGNADFSMHSEKRFNSGIRFREEKDNLSGIKALVVGAGGIGTYVCLNLALMGVGNIDLYDGDTVEDHNLNRQIFYYGSVGKKKADVLSERINRMTRECIRPYACFLKDTSKLKRYDVIFSCLDNWQYRFMLNDYAVKNRIPLINGSVTAFDAYADFYNCLSCKNDVQKLLAVEKSQAPQSGSCSNVVNSNVVMTNAFVGSLMASETKALAFPKKYAPLYKKQFSYNSKSADNLKFVMSDPMLNCLCHKKTKGCECHENWNYQS
ncbi:hypothetical protein FJZ53_03745 [Candidatus Woesearchaeota archaeon]|nr:hypothetical protein [Candidatus Woesearchaeota archaeon]